MPRLWHTFLRYHTNVEPSNLSYCRLSLVTSFASAPNTTVLPLLPRLLTVTGSQTRDHSLLPFVPVLRDMDSSCTTIANPRLFAPRYRACGVGLPQPYRASIGSQGTQDNRPLGREPEEEQDPAHAAQAVLDIQPSSYPIPQLSWGKNKHIPAGKPVGQPTDPLVPCAGCPVSSGSVTAATDAALVEPNHLQLHCAPARVCKIRGGLSSGPQVPQTLIILLRIPVSLSARTASAISLIFLLLSLIYGAASVYY